MLYNENKPYCKFYNPVQQSNGWLFEVQPLHKSTKSQSQGLYKYTSGMYFLLGVMHQNFNNQKYSAKTAKINK